MNKLIKIVIVCAILTGIYITFLLIPHLFLTESGDKLELYLKTYNKYSAITPPTTDRDFWESIPEKPPKRPPDPSLHPYERIKIGTAQEAVYNTGDWIPLIESGLEGTILDPWYDANKHEKPMVGLKATQLAALMAHSLATLDGKLNKDLVERTKTVIKDRVINPYLTDIETFQTKKLFWHEDSCPWLDKDTNWRAVCVANILYAGLIVEDDIQSQAHLLRTAIEQAELYIKTFEEDGYLSAGIRYWNWGFRHYVLLAERILHATGGEINLYDSEKIKRIVEFQLAWNLENNLKSDINEETIFKTGEETKEKPRDYLEEDIAYYPIFADNSNPSTSMPQIRYILSQRFKTPYVGSLLFKDNSELLGPFYSAALGASKIKTSKEKIEENKGDYMVENGKAAIIRDPKDRLVLSIKGGHNGEEHNHNDLGGYTLFQSKKPKTPWEYVTGDAGFGSYAKGTFNAEMRYTFPLLGSYGHPVPVVDNTLQSAGFDYIAKILNSYSNDERACVEYDLKNAYSCPKIQELSRKITYEKNYGTLIVRDSFKAYSPINFETPIITREQPENLGDNWSFKVDGKEYIIEITASAASTVKRATILSDFKGTLSRTSTALNKPALEGYVEYRIRPKNRLDIGKNISEKDITGYYTLDAYIESKEDYGQFTLYRGGDESKLLILKNISTELIGKEEIRQGLPPLSSRKSQDVVEQIQFNLTPWYPYPNLEGVTRGISYTITGDLSVRESIRTSGSEKIKTTLETGLKVSKIESDNYDSKVYLVDRESKSEYILSIYVTNKAKHLNVNISKAKDGNSLIRINFSLDESGALLYKLNKDRPQ